MGSDAFSALTPDLVMDAVERCGREPTGRFSQLNSLENRVFQAHAEDGSCLILKFYRPGRWNDQAILEEHAFLSELAEAGAPVLAPITLPGGSSLGSLGAFRFCAWERFTGRISDEFTEQMLFRAGRALALIHQVGSRSSFKVRPRLDSGSLIVQPLEYLLGSGLVPSGIKQAYRECALAAAAALDASLAGMPSHRIHGDFHWGNILWDGETMLIVDFDDCAEGPAAQDIWMIAPAGDPEGLAKREALLAGYRRLRPFDETWLDAIGPLRAARYVDYAAWIAMRYGEAVFRSSFPNFNEAEHWEAELKDLKDVLMGSLPRQAIPESVIEEYEEASRLTNKDYFFDME
jgi:Ser/Thr protein kinase RdoA (MazF antagonist)